MLKNMCPNTFICITHFVCEHSCIISEQSILFYEMSCLRHLKKNLALQFDMLSCLMCRHSHI